MRNKRYFIVCFENYPHGSAGANYILNFAKSLSFEGRQVVIICCNDKVECINYGKNEGIEYVQVKHIYDSFGVTTIRKKEYEQIARHYKMTNEDYFVFYNNNIRIIRFFCEKYGYSNAYSIRVEDYQPYQYKLGRFNPKYMFERISICYAQKKMNGIISISSLLQKQDKKAGARTLILPPLTDPDLFKENECKKITSKIHILYPGMKMTGYEDDYDLMFNALMKLDEKDIEKISLHITGGKYQKIIEKFNLPAFSKIKNVVQFHGFLEYDELINLYRQAHYLLLVRKKNNVTMANFPSKVPELLTYGIVPICTDVGDYTKKYLDENCAIIMPPDDEKECVNAIKKAIALSQEEYNSKSRKARMLAETKFSYKVWSEKLIDFMEENND